MAGVTIFSPRPPKLDLPKLGSQKMKVKRKRDDFDKIVIPHIQASFLSFSSFDFLNSCISLGSGLFFLYFFLAHLTFFFFGSRSCFFLIFYFILSSVLDPLFYHLNQTNIRENYISSILSLVYPFSHFLSSYFFHPSNQMGPLH